MQNAPHKDHSRNKKAVLLVNLGTPDDPSVSAVRAYLKQFLSDKRVIEIPALLWKLILYGIILPFRAKKSAANYKKIWDEDRHDSPLRLHLKDLKQALQNHYGDKMIIEAAMRYGKPSLDSSIKKESMVLVEAVCCE